jgi:purine nucleosidase
MKKIILFADTGIDDAVALIYALKNSEIDLLGIVSSFGNIERDKSYRNVKYLLNLAGRGDIPVIAGSTRPLSGGDPLFFPDIHGEEGLGPIKPPIPEDRYSRRTNFSKLFTIIKNHPGEITIVSVGRCTDLAIAWYLSPEVMKTINATYIMGGAFLVSGNVTETSEANFFGDSIAANFVCNNVPNLTVIPLNVTRNALLRPDDVNFIADRANSPLEEVIKPMVDYYYEVYQRLEPGIEGTPQHDLTAVMAALELPGLYTYIQRKVKVEYTGHYSNGLSIADFRPVATNCDEDDCVRIAVSIDENKFLTNVLNILTNNE